MHPTLWRPLGSLPIVFFATASFAADPTPGPAHPATSRPAHELTEVWSPEPPVISAPAEGIPSDAVVLFDGKNLDAWESAKSSGPAPWKIEGDAMVIVPKTGDLRSKAAFGDVQLHAEWRSPAEVKGEGQGRGNSGIYFMGLYEVQVLDSYQNKTYVNGQAGSIYKEHIPLANPARPPGVWQSYDIVFIAPRFDDHGTLLRPARATVFFNGVLVLHDVVLTGPTPNGSLGTYELPNLPPYQAHPTRLPFILQNHGNPVAFRNLWVRDLTLPDAR